MGLGKTVQAITFLAALCHERCPRPHLVVVPISTLPNWQREFARFAPQLNVVALAGERLCRTRLGSPSSCPASREAWCTFPGCRIRLPRGRHATWGWPLLSCCAGNAEARAVVKEYELFANGLGARTINAAGEAQHSRCCWEAGEGL